MPGAGKKTTPPATRTARAVRISMDRDPFPSRPWKFPSGPCCRPSLFPSHENHSGSAPKRTSRFPNGREPRLGREVGRHVLELVEIAHALRRREDVSEVQESYECGIGVEGFSKFENGDIIEVYEIKEIKRTL